MNVKPNLPPPARVLVVDDEPEILRYMRTVLESGAYAVETAESGVVALDRLRKDPPPDVVLLDLMMPELDGLQTLARLLEIRPSQRVIMLSCATEPRRVVEAMRLGAQDYLSKPFQKAEFDVVLRQSLSVSGVAGSPESLGPPTIIEELGDDISFLAVSPAMRKVYEQAQQIAAVDLPVLLLGESGTGKEVVARLIHRFSPRARQTFLKVNCAALPADLLESELFGYEAGAFTGAVRSKPGKFELSDKGTILLDEIGEMPPGLQAKLLHVLQDGRFSRLGARGIVQVDVRVLAATNVDVQKALQTRQLREDLYYRLNGLTIHLPPLRERREEIPSLLRHFLSTFAAQFGRDPLPLSATLLDRCLQHDWPGNLRELENFVKRYLILGQEDLALGELDLSRNRRTPPASSVKRETGPLAQDLKSLVRNLKGVAELEAISKALAETGWNRRAAARQLKISYKALLYKIRQYGIRPPA